MGHIHDIKDSDKYFIIDPITRGIKNDSNKKITLIQYDHNSERFTFEIPKEIESHDMSQCNKVEVHYFNIDSQTRKQNSGIYEVDDLQIDPENQDAVICSWLISKGSTKLNGILKFLLRYKCVDENDIETYSWNTAFFTGISVSEGSDADESFEREYADVIEQWKDSVLAYFKGKFGAEADRAVAEYSEKWTNGLNAANEKIGFLSNYVTPQMFGAKGDGVTDDTEAFKRAIEHVASMAFGTGWKSVKKIFIPQGTYLISDSLLNDEDFEGHKFVFEGDSYTNTFIKVTSDCEVLFPNNDIYGFSTFSNISFIGADNTQTFMEIMSGATGNAQSIYFHRCSFSKFHTILKLGKATGVTTGTMTSETLLSECKISNCGTSENPCELFILDNQQSVNNRFFATDIEAFVGVLFKFKAGNAITFYQGSIIPLSGSIIVDGTELDGNTSGGGNQPNLTMWGCRFELRGNTKLLNHGTNWGQLVLSFNECGMGCSNLDDGVKTISIKGTSSAYLFFNKCRNAKTLFAEMVDINSSTSRSNVLTKIHFDECDLNAKEFVENSVFSYVGNNTYIAHPEIRINGIHYNLDKDVKKAPLGKHLKVIEKGLIDGVYYTGIECGNENSPKTCTVDIYSYIQEISINNLGNEVYKGYTTNKLSCAIYDETDSLIGSIGNIPLSSGSGTLPVNKYVKTLKMVFTTDLTGKNPILPILALAKIIG